MNKNEERIARTEALFRAVNERIAEAARRFGSDDAAFVCECSDEACTERVDASLVDYERARTHGTHFLVPPRPPARTGLALYSSEMNLASSTSARRRATSSGGAGWSIESAISALPPRRVRETVMFAMLTPASPKSVPTRPITPGTSS